jgi:peptide methionine sulfoxide reductase msrA/msrB
MKNVILGGGCFWCVEHDLREAPGVTDVISGYSGEGGRNPTYENHEGYREVAQIFYDENKTNFKKLLQFFLDHIDPTDDGGQFGDRGESYKTAIYYKNEEEKNIAEDLLKELDESHLYEKKVAVDIIPEMHFYKAEEYHQNYAEKNPEHYAMYRKGSGREDFVARTCQIREEKKMNWK